MLIKLLKKVKSETVKLKFQHLGTTKNIRLGVFSDASLANLPDGGSQGGNIIFSEKMVKHPH